MKFFNIILIFILYIFSYPVSSANKFNLIPTSVYGKKIPKGYENAFRTISPLTILERANKILSTKHHQNQ